MRTDSHHRVDSRRAVTIIELMIVLTIISIVCALAIPTMQSARERARIIACTNNIHQMRAAMGHFIMINKRLPAPVPLGQIGGWSVEILPYLDAAPVWFALKNNPDDARVKSIQANPPEVFSCPSRPNQQLRQFSHYAMERDTSSPDSTAFVIFDAPLSMEYSWTSGLEMPFGSQLISRAPQWRFPGRK
jgi:prepilin-type N-terminal cleavage/methylation domain-containing protein